MARSQKEFELLFKLKASLGGNFNGTFKKAINTNNQLKDSLKNVNSIQSKIDGFQKQTTAIEKNRQKLDSLNASHEKIADGIEKHRKNISELENKIAETGDTTGELTIQLQKEREALEKSTEKLARNESQIQQTSARIKEQEKQLNSYADELRKAGVNTDNLEESNSRLQKSYERLQNSQKTLQKINEKQQQVQQSISQTKGQLVGTIGAIGTVAAAVYAGPVKSAMTLQQEMKNAGTLLDGDVTSKLSALSNEVVKVSNNTGIGTSDLTDGLYQVVSAFGETTESIQQLEVAAKAAKAGGATTTDAINLLSAVTKGYGDTSAEAQQKAADLAFQTVKLGQTDFPSLASSIGKVIPLAATLGTTQEDLFGAMATLTGVTGGTADVTTQLKAAMQGFLSPSTNMAKALKSMGYESGKALLESKGLQGSLEALKDSVGGDELAFAKLFTSVEAQTAVLALATTQADNFTEKTKQMYEATGAAQQAYETATDSTEAKMAKAKNSIANLGIVLGQNLLPIVGDLADKVAVAVTKVSEFAQENPKLVQTVSKVVAGLAAARVGFLGLKLAGLTGETGIISIIQKLVELRAGMLENAATSVSFATKLSGAGKGLISYFSNVKSALGGVGSAVGNIFNGNEVIKAVTGFMDSQKKNIVDGIAGLAKGAKGKLLFAGTEMQKWILKPFSKLGKKTAPFFAEIALKAKNSTIGKVGGFITKGITGAFSKATALIAPLGNAVKTVLGPIGNLAKTALGPLGGIAGKILPVVGVFTAIVTVIQLVKNHLEEIRGFIQRTFGDEALAVFNKIVNVIQNVGNTIKGVFSDGNIGAARDKIQELFGDKGAAVFDTLVNVIGTVKNAVSDVVGFIVQHVVPVAEDVLQVIISQVIPGIVSFIQAAAPTIMAIIQSIADFIGAIIPVIGSFIAGLMPVIREIISFISTYVLPIISDLFSFICSTVLPAVSAAVQAILPVVQNVLQTLLPAIQTALTAIWNIVRPVIQGILAAVQAAMPTIQAVVTAVVNAISGVISGLATVLNGIITFITGVFTGNWRQAWDGIKSIFSGIWESIKSAAKGAVNGIISIINGMIGGLNKLKLPDWIPGIGGKGINISLIPMLAKGSRYTPDTFIAGEKGPELITNARGRTVFTAEQTRNILAAQNAAAETAAAVAPTTAQATAQTVNNYHAAPEVTAGAGSGGGTNYFTINNSPTIVIEGDKPDDLDAKLEENNIRLLRQVEELMDDKEDKERRQEYD